MDQFEDSKCEVVVFAGSMNAMPYMYASELRRLGYSVLYLVDAKRSNYLCRPECHYNSVRYPYPPWIVEAVLPSQILVALFPKLFAAWLKWRVGVVRGRKPARFVLNGFFVSLAPYLNTTAIGLSHGSDLDAWADEEHASQLAEAFRRRSVFRFLPRKIAKQLINTVVKRQFRGFLFCKTVLYFPKGFHLRGDRIIDKLVRNGSRYVPRYDMSFEPAACVVRGLPPEAEKLRIVSAVRFKFATFADGGMEENKGNDIIIRGLAHFYKSNPNIEVHFVEKGEDVAHAKTLCYELNLDAVVTWHSEMPLAALLSLYERMDICFDQVGSHWIGAIGGYALYLGKPLIANPELAVRSGVWPEKNPICAAKSVQDVSDWLNKLKERTLREEISRLSMAFAEKYLGPGEAFRKAFEVK
jgi:hypothetical protein